MNPYRILWAAGLVLCAVILTGPASAADAVPSFVTAAVNDPGRPFDDRARDANRKPAEVAAFAEVKPGQVVVDLVPGGGYYTRILSKIAGAKGRVYALVPMPMGAAAPLIKARDAAMARGETPPPLPVDRVLAIQNIPEYKNVTVIWEALGAFGGQFALPEQIDTVWTTDNYHDLHTPAMGLNGKILNMLVVDREIFRAMKPGGVFMVGDNKAADGTAFTVAGTLHRSDETAVKAEILQAGFVLDGESNVLANPADDHTAKVFAMHDKTDQFLLRFKKPDNAPNLDARPPKEAIDGYYGNTLVYGPDDPNTRWVYMHPDGTYQEWGNSGSIAQEGLWFWDAAGRNCLIHQFPSSERAGTVCHPIVPYKKVGDVWKGDNDRTIRLEAGYFYPDMADIHPCDPYACQAPGK